MWDDRRFLSDGRQDHLEGNCVGFYVDVKGYEFTGVYISFWRFSMIPALPECANWFLLLCITIASTVGCGWWWQTQRQESVDTESWDKFNGFMAFVEKSKREKA